MKEKNNKKPPVSWGTVLLRVAAVLFCLLLISIYLMSGLYARYITREQGGDSARVAGFDVKMKAPSDVTCEVTALHPGVIELTVENDSEVAVSYGFRVKISENTSCGVLTILDNDPAKRLEFAELGDVELSYGSVGVLAVGADAVTHTLSFEPLDWTKITAEVAGESGKLQRKFTIYVDAVQID